MCDLCGKRFKYGPVYAATVDGRTYIYHPACGYLLPDKHNDHDKINELKFEAYGDSGIEESNEVLLGRMFCKINEIVGTINYLIGTLRTKKISDDKKDGGFEDWEHYKERLTGVIRDEKKELFDYIWAKLPNEVYRVEEWVTERIEKWMAKKKREWFGNCAKCGKRFEEGEGCYFYKNWGTVCFVCSRGSLEKTTKV